MTRPFIVMLVTLVVIAALVACSPAARLSGTELPAKDAPDFTLADGLTGQTVTLASMRGNVVVLSFLYTRCPDVCPITAALSRSRQKTLGVDGYSFVAVSVDPEGDTPAQVRTFSTRMTWARAGITSSGRARSFRRSGPRTASARSRTRAASASRTTTRSSSSTGRDASGSSSTPTCALPTSSRTCVRSRTRSSLCARRVRTGSTTGPGTALTSRCSAR